MAHVYIQLGHCNRSSGATGTAGEQAFAKSVGGHLDGRLRWYGHTAQQLLADQPIPPPVAGTVNAFVALHMDGSTNANARGASAGHRTPEGQRLAQAWKQAYQLHGWPSGFRPDNYTAGLAQYYGVRQAVDRGIPYAFIVEGGFGTNAGDRAWLDANHPRVAQSIVDAIGAVLGHPDPTAGGRVGGGVLPVQHRAAVVFDASAPVDEGIARVLARALTLPVLPLGHRERVGGAIAVGKAAGTIDPAQYPDGVERLAPSGGRDATAQAAWDRGKTQKREVHPN